MASRLGFGPASTILGAIWGLWHLPLFFVPGEDYGQPFFVFAMGTTALSVAIGWLYANSKGSLLLTMLMHSAVNQTVGLVPDRLAEPGNPFSLRAPIPFYLTVGFLWIAAAYFLVRFRHGPAALKGGSITVEDFRRPASLAENLSIFAVVDARLAHCDYGEFVFSESEVARFPRCKHRLDRALYLPSTPPRLPLAA
jgi:hypothetical protein